MTKSPGSPVNKTHTGSGIKVHPHIKPGSSAKTPSHIKSGPGTKVHPQTTAVSGIRFHSNIKAGSGIKAHSQPKTGLRSKSHSITKSGLGANVSTKAITESLIKSYSRSAATSISEAPPTSIPDSSELNSDKSSDTLDTTVQPETTKSRAKPNSRTKALPEAHSETFSDDAVKMNQLQNLLHDALISTDHVQQCAIIYCKDCSIRASSLGFTLYPDQVQMLLDAFRNPPQTREEGIYFSDQQYKCVRADRNSIYAKCNKNGLVLVKTNTLLLVATYTENMFAGICVEAVEKLADYFKEKGK